MEERVIKTIGLALNQDLNAYKISECVPGNITGWDSLSFLNIIALLEEEFGVSFYFAEIAQMTTGGDDLLKIIKQKLG